MLIRLCNSNIMGKMQMFTKQIFLHQISKVHANFKSNFQKQFLKYIITLLKAKLLAKIVEISIQNKKYCNEKSYNVFGKYVSHLTGIFFAVMYVDTVFCAFMRSFANT